MGCLVFIAGCAEEPKPLAHGADGLGDVQFPEFAALKRPVLSKQVEHGPAPFTAIECENTYVAGSEPPSPAQPSLWIQQGELLERVDGLASISDGVEEPWADRPWSVEFRDGNDQLVCEGKATSRAQAGEAYSTYLYPRVLLDGMEWLRPAPRDLTPSEEAELGAMSSTGWTPEKARRLIELNPNSYESGWVRYWANAVAWAEKEGHDDLEYELRRRYRPTAQCGNDTYPSTVSKKLRNHCLMTGRFGCVAEYYGFTKPPLPQPANMRARDLPEGVDRLRYILGLMIEFPGSFNGEMKLKFFNFQDRQFATDFYDRAVELALLPETDAYTRHQLAILAHEAAKRGADLKHMDEAPDRTIGSLMTPESVFVRQLRRVAKEPWIPAATRSRFTRQADRLEELNKLADAEDWEALQQQASGHSVLADIWIDIGPDTMGFTAFLPKEPGTD